MICIHVIHIFLRHLGPKECDMLFFGFVFRKIDHWRAFLWYIYLYMIECRTFGPKRVEIRIVLPLTCIPFLHTCCTTSKPSMDNIEVWVLLALSLSHTESSFCFMKLSNTVPVPTVNPPKSIQSDLKHISLTPIASKVLEYFPCEWIYDCIKDKLDPRQFGGIKKYVCSCSYVWLFNGIWSCRSPTNVAEAILSRCSTISSKIGCKFVVEYKVTS